MTLHSLPFLSHSTTDQPNTNTKTPSKKSGLSTKTTIIIAIVAGTILITLVASIIYFLRKRSQQKRKAKQGTILKETGEYGMDEEEAKPMVSVPLGGPRPLVLQPGMHAPPRGEVMFESGYGDGPHDGGHQGQRGTVYGDISQEGGHRGTDFYRNQ